jgi:hypothetical protein
MTPAERVAYDVGQALGVGEKAGEFALDHLHGLLEREPTPQEVRALTDGFGAGVRLAALQTPPEGREV